MAIFSVTVKPAVCAIASSIIVSNITQTSFFLDWGDALNALEYEIEIISVNENASLDQDNITLDSTSNTLDSESTDLLGLDNTIVTLDNDIITLDSQSFETIFILQRINESEFLVENLLPGRRYQVRIRSICVNTESPFTDPIFVVTLEDDPLLNFKASNQTIRVSNNNLKISELQITNSEI